MLDASVDDIYNWISPIIESSNANGKQSKSESDKNYSQNLSLNPNSTVSKPFRKLTIKGESETSHDRKLHPNHPDTPLSEPESIETVSSSTSTPCVECLEQQKANSLANTSMINDPSCVECEVAMKDHLLQIYDPFIDYCARCQEAEKDHQLRNSDCPVSIQSDCEECYEVEKDQTNTNTNSMVNIDVLTSPPAMILSKKALLENQIQPKYSDSRHEARNTNNLKRKRIDFEKSLAESHQQQHRKSSNDDSLSQNIARQYNLLLHQAQQQYYRNNQDDHNQDPHSNPNSRSLYCHWNGHDDEVQFNSELALQAHLRNHIDPQIASTAEQLACQWDSCDVSLKFVDELLEHIRTDHYNNYGRPHTNCSHDSHRKITPTSLSPSNNISTPDQETFKCQWGDCQFVANNSELLGFHVLNDHINNTPGVVRLPPTQQSNDMNGFINTDGMFQCQYQSCDFESLNFNDFTSHIKSDHLIGYGGNPPISSSTALDNFLTSAAESSDIVDGQHFSSPTLVGSTDSVPAQELTCQWILENGQLCSCQFANTQELSDHITESHVGLRKTEYICSWRGCDRNHRPFQQRQKMVRHLQVHTNHRPYKCQVCGSTFGEESVLKQHLRVHSGERPFECKICHKKFAASAALSVHLRVHTGEKPLKCKYPGCEKRFSESSNLNKHLKTHFTGYPCVCPICNESFGDPDQLHRHFKGH